VTETARESVVLSVVSVAVSLGDLLRVWRNVWVNAQWDIWLNLRWHVSDAMSLCLPQRTFIYFLFLCVTSY